jgi:LPS-assembly lipoprotein
MSAAALRPGWKRSLRRLALAAMILLAGCGFQLQGRRPMPAALKVTCVISPDDQTDFVQDLRKDLLISGSRLTPEKQEASAVVEIVHDQVVERVVSVSAQNLPREYELTHTVRFRVTSGDQTLLELQELNGTRNYSFDETRLLAKQNEESILRQALAADLANVVMRRLSRL